LAQHAFGYRLIEGVMTLKLTADECRKEIVDYLKDPSKKVDIKIRFQAIKYVLLEENCIIGQLMEFCSNTSIEKKQRC